jgi:hypothetical protein
LNPFIQRLSLLVGVVLLLPSAAHGDPAPPPVRGFVPGDTYRIEAEVGSWSPRADMKTAGTGLGVPGTRIDMNQEFGLEDRGLPELRLAVRPGARHRLRLEYVPFRYESTATLSRDITFNGVVYPAGSPATATVAWQAIRLRYEYRFLVRRRTFAGLLFEVDRTNLQVRLRSAFANERASSSVPTIPAIGGIVRIYPAGRVAVTGQVTGFGVPDRPNQQYGGHYLNAEVDGTVTVARHLGVRAGYRTINIRHLGEADSGTLRMSGLSFGVVVRR